MKQIGSLVLLLLLFGCQVAHHDAYHDPYLGLSKQETRQAFLPPQVKLQPRAVAPRSFMKGSLLSVEEPFPLGGAKKISLSTTADVPLKTIFHSLGRDCNLTISINNNVQGGITYHAHLRPCSKIIGDLCRAGNLRSHVKQGVVHIQADLPYMKTYQLQYLTLSRKNESRISIATDVFTTIDQQHNQVDNGSNALLKAESSSDFWQELETSIKSLLNSYGEGLSFTLHRQAGLLSIFAPARAHEDIQGYLKTLETTMTSQVLIEAKIIEVQLKEEFKSGVNWHAFKGDAILRMPMGDIMTPGPFDPRLTPPRDVATFGGAGTHLTGLISFLNTFGTVRTLSNPRLTVMNNQSAILKVATNEVFFRIDYNRESGLLNTREREQVSSEIHTVPIGLVMLVHPAINLATQNIIMTLRPTISRIVDQKEDPAVNILSQQTQRSYIPQVQVREFDSVVNVTSGQPLIMAGLMDDRGDMYESGVPEISDVPLLGALFKGKSSGQQKTELVIFLQAYIVPSYGENSTITPQDHTIYSTFADDPRPLKDIKTGA